MSASSSASLFTHSHHSIRDVTNLIARMKKLFSLFRQKPSDKVGKPQQTTMKTTIQEQDGRMVALLKGTLDTAAAREAEQVMNVLYDVEGKDIVLDCTDLDYISSAGLRIFLGILQYHEERGGHVFLRGVNDKVRDIFVLTGFNNIFEFI